jgi:hypothetical protein
MQFAEAIGLAFSKDTPFGSSLYFKGNGDVVGVKAPHYIDYILKGLKRGMNNRRLTCIVLPKKGYVAHAAWVVQAAETLVSDLLPHRINEHKAQQLNQLPIGSYVKTYPGEKVFIWGGMTQDGKGNPYLSFKVIGKNSTNNQSEANFSPLRVKVYPGVNPPAKQRGKLEDLTATPLSTGLDAILPIKCYDNKDLVSACACLIANSSDVSDFINSVMISKDLDGPYVSIKESLRSKSVDDIEPARCTCLHAGDLVGAYETLSTRTDLPLGQKTPVIIDGLKLIRDISHIQALRFDAKGTQRPIVVVAEYTERPQIEKFADAFDFWEVHHSEIEHS